MVGRPAVVGAETCRRIVESIFQRHTFIHNCTQKVAQEEHTPTTHVLMYISRHDSEAVSF